uniref:Uncharacterized protein n=1 Tax=viral metagenome TaxID=1070528 RepID=A0A6H1ZGN9_9ZZZZ
MAEPTNEALGIMIQGVNNNLDDLKIQNERAHSRLENHAIKTNGRVSRNEMFRYMMIGGLVLTNIIIIPTALVILSAYIKSK